ncbi:TetR family transcriptional regulator C-terminal domain-containing protein [Fructilactobacillus hinvesii]|uniref:TetR family transcriptional regulator C-terminal domain-containing protein n=1 Tax=Fructilactobacillus hinvesii TaxID=2940300 RepID=A0ABY5BTU4_9LACO|nr:TetR family transcriptional regulator C-terminal domain-containing protein [Fructilactobacillus hinvesii]USS88365.1 TetR family transcriptional regulator C-terminal domain-containing protein [Fructilactobacillus hinvesii]
MNQTDRRVRKTKQAIRTSLEHLLQTKTSLEEISVTEICDTADIGRKTFYSHYTDKYALMDDFLDAYLAELRITCTNITDPHDFAQKTSIWVTFFWDHRRFFRLLFADQGPYQFRQKLFDFTYEQFIEKLKLKPTTAVRFICHGIDGLINDLVTSETTPNQEQLVQAITNLLHVNLTAIQD